MVASEVRQMLSDDGRPAFLISCRFSRRISRRPPWRSQQGGAREWGAPRRGELPLLRRLRWGAGLLSTLRQLDKISHLSSFSHRAQLVGVPSTL